MPSNSIAPLLNDGRGEVCSRRTVIVQYPTSTVG